MKKYILGLFAISFVLAPLLSFAQVEYPDPSPYQTDCVSIYNNLRYRDRDIYKNGEVSVLQDFLQGKGYLNNEPTGYFGLLTLSAVKNFQGAYGITPVSGYVGPITRAKIKEITCGGINPISSIAVLSPNGGEVLYKWNNQNITWQDNTTFSCPNMAYCVPPLPLYDISVSTYCTGNCITVAPMVYTIAQNVATTHNYNWQVGYTLNNVLLSSGTYKITVCRTGSNTCDTSDSPFTIQ